MKFIVWKGAASRDFHHVFKEFDRSYKPDIFILLKPRVSGSHADDICVVSVYQTGCEWRQLISVGELDFLAG